MAGNKDNVSADQLVGHGHSLVRITTIVDGFQHQCLAVDPAGRIEIGNRLFRANTHFFTESSKLPFHRPGNSDPDVGDSRCRNEAASQEASTGQKLLKGHSSPQDPVIAPYP